MIKLTLITVVAIIAIIIAFRKLWRISKKEAKIDESDFIEVKDFDKNIMINDSFDKVIHSISINEDWIEDSGDNSLRFTKKLDEKDTIAWNRDEVILTVRYRIEKGKFIVRELYLSSNLSNFSKEGDKITIKQKKIFYDKYVEYKNRQNDMKKSEILNSLSKINLSVGKSSIRDKKIDDILNDI
jgi:hypothetical protein